MLKAFQMNASTPAKDYLNPWAAFAVVGVLQGVVYGQANIHFTRTLKLVSHIPTMTLAGVMRGSVFAAGRDMVSQGAPFVLSGSVREALFDPMLPADEPAEGMLARAAHWGGVGLTSVLATVASQGLHNAQIKMQSDQTLSYAATVRTLWRENGLSVLYRGAEARIGLLLIVNLLNEAVLKPAWEGVE